MYTEATRNLLTAIMHVIGRIWADVISHTTNFLEVDFMKWTWKVLLIGIGIATFGVLLGDPDSENVQGFMGLGFLMAIVGLVSLASDSGKKDKKSERVSQPAPIHNHVTISLDMQKLKKLIRE